MSTKPVVDDGGRAFPYQVSDQSGMSLRDYFAAHALAGLISNMTYGGELQRIFDEKKAIGNDSESPQQYVASLAMTFADAMLEARKQ